MHREKAVARIRQRPVRQCPRPWLIACSLILHHVGCSETNAGTTLVDELPSIEVEEAFRIGSVDDPDLGFSSIGGVTVDREGTAFVFDRRDVTIRAYDADGTLQTKFGGPGEGPGEFRLPTALGFRADTLWVLDIRLRRISLFSRTGEFIRSTTCPASHSPSQMRSKANSSALACAPMACSTVHG